MTSRATSKVVETMAPLYQPQDRHFKTWFADAQDQLVTSVGGIGLLNRVYLEGSLVKEAASAVFSKRELDELKPPPGYFMVHQIGVGAGEAFGWNRNGDYFPKEALVKYHPTFVSHGAQYREHRNTDRRLAIGQIKAARYNHEMERTEQVLWSEIRKCADAYEAAKAGEETAYSMSCYVPYDICSVCEKRARSTAEYCPDLKRHMGHYDRGARKYAYAINTKPTFTDMSLVARPADRTAWSLSYGFADQEGLAKAASAMGVQERDLSGLLGFRSSVFAAPDARDRAILQKLASYEARLEQASRTGNFDGSEWEKAAYQYVLPGASSTLVDFETQDFDRLRRMRPGVLLGELAKRACMCGVAPVVSLFDGTPLEQNQANPVVMGAQNHLPGIFRMLGQVADLPESEGLPFLDTFRPSSIPASMDPAYDSQIDRLLSRATTGRSCALGNGGNTIIRITIEKRAAAPDVPGSQDVALLYGVYKLAACRAILDACPSLEEEPFLLLVAAQNSF